MTTPDAPDSLASRVAALEKRMVAVEAHATPAAGDTGNTNGAQGSSPSTQDHLWALRGLKQYEDDSEGGTVMLVGSVELPGSGPVSWQIGAHADELLSDEWDTVTAVLDALAHPIRLRILKEVLTGENSTARELAELESMGSTGQVYHHLRAPHLGRVVEAGLRGQTHGAGRTSRPPAHHPSGGRADDAHAQGGFPWLLRAFVLLVALSFVIEVPVWLVFAPLGLAIAVPSPRADDESPQTMHAPVTGRWVAINSPATKVPSHGVRTLGQAFAVDILQASDSPRESAPGWQWRQAEPQEFPSFGEPVLAAGSGTVIAAHDGKRDHRARNTWPGLIYMMSLEAFGRELAGHRSIIGNHVILDHSDGTFSMYAHLKHGSAAVCVGQKVRAGDVLGAVGNTGNTSEPHLHFQLMDRPQAAMAAGLPFRWSPLTIEPDPDPHWAPKKPVAETVEGLPATGQIFRTPESGVMPQPKREASC